MKLNVVFLQQTGREKKTSFQKDTLNPTWPPEDVSIADLAPVVQRMIE